jgi:hypothetical protein
MALRVEDIEELPVSNSPGENKWISGAVACKKQNVHSSYQQISEMNDFHVDGTWHSVLHLPTHVEFAHKQQEQCVEIHCAG